MDREEKQPTFIDQERGRLRSAFGAYLSPLLEKRKGESLRILSVGCGGIASEAKPLIELFPNAQYCGIDIREDCIRGAGRVNESKERAVFAVEDACDPKAFGDRPWDVIIVRHPQVRGSIRDTSEQSLRRDWATIFTNSMNALTKGGILFVSTDDLLERELVVHYVADKQLEVILNEENAFGGGIFHSDRFVLVAKRKL